MNDNHAAEDMERPAWIHVGDAARPVLERLPDATERKGPVRVTQQHGQLPPGEEGAGGMGWPAARRGAGEHAAGRPRPGDLRSSEGGEEIDDLIVRVIRALHGRGLISTAKRDDALGKLARGFELAHSAALAGSSAGYRSGRRS